MKTSAKILVLLGISGQSQAQGSKAGLLSTFGNQKLLEDIMLQQEAEDYDNEELL
jgi:hypothetical protein